MEVRHGHIEHLSENAGRELFRRGHFGHLGFKDEGSVDVLPINYIYHEGSIYCHSREGRKIRAMRKHPHICIQTEEVVDLFNWQSAIAWGVFKECDEFESEQIMRLILEKMATPNEQLGKSALEEDFAAMLDHAIIFKLEIQKIAVCSESNKTIEKKSE